MDQNDWTQEKEGKKVRENKTSRRNLIKESRKYKKRIK